MKKLKIFYIVLIFLFTTISAVAQNNNYYIDKNAAGSNNGSSWVNAWQSFADINWNIIQPGDSVLISGGSDSTTYDEMIDIPSQKSGSAGHTIIISRGKDSGHNGIVILDGINLPNLPAVRIDHSSYLTVNGLKMIRWLSSPSNLGTISVYASDHIIIENNVIIAWCQGLKIGESQNCIFRNNRYTTIGFIENQTDGIYAHLNLNNIYEGNYINISNGAPDEHNDCFQGQEEGPCIIRGNIMLHSGASALKAVNSQGIFDKYSCGLHQYINNIVYLPNLSTPQQQMNDGVLDQQNPTPQFPGDGEPANIIALNNTIIGASTHTFAFESDQLICKNNLVIILDNIGEVKYSNGVDLNNIDYNLYYKNGTVGNPIINDQYTLSEWQQLGGDLHSLNANPLLNNSFHPTSNSPVIDAGTNLSSFGDTTDLNGILRPQGPAYDIGAFEYDGQTFSGDGGYVNVDKYRLSQNYPNPFNPNTTIKYSIGTREDVNLKLYNVLGKEIAVLVNSIQEAGEHKVNFNASKFASGIYFYSIKAGGYFQTKKMVLLK